MDTGTCPITIEYTAKPEDLGAFYDFAMRRSGRTRCIVVLGSLFPGFVPLFMDFSFGRKIGVRDWITASVIAIVFYFLFPVFFRFTAKKDNRVLTISPKSIATTIGRMKKSIPWQEVEAVEATDEHIFILVRNLNGFAIPRRAFQDEAQRQTFLQSCQEYLGNTRMGKA